MAQQEEIKSLTKEIYKLSDYKVKLKKQRDEVEGKVCALESDIVGKMKILLQEYANMYYKKMMPYLIHPYKVGKEYTRDKVDVYVLHGDYSGKYMFMGAELQHIEYRFYNNEKEIIEKLEKKLKGGVEDIRYELRLIFKNENGKMSYPPLTWHLVGYEKYSEGRSPIKCQRRKGVKNAQENKT